LRKRMSWAVIACLMACSGADAAGLVTVRLGEQDTCKIKGVTTVEYDRPAKLGRIRFDLSKLPKGARVVRAELRFWINGFQD